MSKRDYYEALGVKKTATHDEIRSAYRKLAMAHHPDKHQGDKAAEEKFKEISEAYEVLSDSQKKQLYDRYGHDGLKNAFGSGGFQWSDFTHQDDVQDIFQGIFESFGLGGDMFGFGGRSRKAGPQKGANIKAEVEVDLKEAAFGTEKTVSLSRAEACKECKGSGAKSGTKEAVCKTCEGTGRVTTVSGFFSLSQTCHECGGKGSVIKTPCAKCRGSGHTEESTKIKVKVPRGVDNGTRLRITGEGEAGHKGGPRGDLYVDVFVKKDQVFERHENDIYCEVPISFATAVFGGDIDVPTLEGTEKLEIPKETPCNKIFKMRQKGIYDLHGRGRGDEIVRVVIETPRNLNEDQKKKLKEFAALCGDDVHPQSADFFKKIKELFK